MPETSPAGPGPPQDASSDPARGGREPGIDRLPRLVVGAIAAVALGLVLAFGVDVPYGDDWDTPGALLERLADGEPLSWGDFFAQHNESRPAVPRLLFVATSLVSGWHPKQHMLLSWATCLVGALALVGCLADRSRSSAWRVALAAAVVGLLLFSPIQARNQLWAIQLVVFLPATCLVLCLVMARRLRSLPAVFLGSALACAVATFSFANGPVVWLLGFPGPSLWLRSRRGDLAGLKPARLLAWALVFGALAAAVLGAFYAESGTGSGSTLQALRAEPVAAARFFLAWTGAPFAPPGSAEVAAGLGAALLIVVLAILVLWTGAGDDASAASLAQRVLDAYPWLVMLGYGLLSGAATALLRLEAAAPVAARYATLALWIPVGATGLLFLGGGGSRRSGAALRRAGAGALALVLAAAAAVSWLGGAERMRRLHYDLEVAAMTLGLLDRAPENPLLLHLYPDPDLVRRRTGKLRQAGFLPEPRTLPWLESRIGSEAADAKGRWDVWVGPRRIRFAGRATLPPPSDRPADALVLCLRHADGHCHLLGAWPPSPGGNGRFDLLAASHPGPLSELELYALDTQTRLLHRVRRSRSRR